MKKRNLFSFLCRRPDAQAIIKGDSRHSEISGRVLFYTCPQGVTVRAEISGLPKRRGNCSGAIFAFHIHDGQLCSGKSGEPFTLAGEHYNPYDCPHPYHAGDLPPLFSAGGDALLTFLTDRFSINEIIDKTVIIHSRPDDFSTQPSGNAGTRIACGQIIRA